MRCASGPACRCCRPPDPVVTEVKICGVRDPEAMDAVAEALAEWVGFVFFPPSPRAIEPAAAAALAARHPGGPRAVGLFVDPEDTDIATVLDALPLAALQVHASAERAAAVQARFGLPVWHAVGIATAADLPSAAPGVRRLLLDHKAPPGATLPGGNATAFDWSVLRNWAAPVPWVLAGGLTPHTVTEAIGLTGAPAVDVSSGVERSRGIKDPALIRAFVAAAKAAPTS